MPPSLCTKAPSFRLKRRGLQPTQEFWLVILYAFASNRGSSLHKDSRSRLIDDCAADGSPLRYNFIPQFVLRKHFYRPRVLRRRKFQRAPTVLSFAPIYTGGQFCAMILFAL